MKIKKILDLDKLSSLVAKYKKRKRKIVLCHGVFDLLHLGHIKHFEEAKVFLKDDGLKFELRTLRAAENTSGVAP